MCHDYSNIYFLDLLNNEVRKVFSSNKKTVMGRIYWKDEKTIVFSYVDGRTKWFSLFQLGDLIPDIYEYNFETSSLMYIDKNGSSQGFNLNFSGVR